MYELVVHHRYASGSADLSGHRNDGHRSPATGDETSLEVFDGLRSRIVTFPSPSLTALGGLRASARICLEELGQRRTIMEGYLAFALFMESDGALGGSILSGEWSGLTSPPESVPLGRWTEVSYLYDGRDTSALAIDGKIVAVTAEPFGAVGDIAWPYGLNTGAWPDANLRVFKGRIAEVKLWRLAR
jgi:hypothetical protein